MKGPLSDLRVIDLSRALAGPHAASHGLTTDSVIADVIDKVPIP